MKTVEYYLMRHASYYDLENQFVSYYGFITLKNSMDRLLVELNEKFPNKGLRIIHSMLPRAKHTSLLMEEMLKDISIFKRGDHRLNSDKLQISDAYIREVVTSCEKEDRICLILSHQPDIEYFCKQRLETSQFIRMTAQIEETVPQKESDDDLPF